MSTGALDLDALQAVLEHLADGVAICDGSARIVYANPAWAALQGASPSALAGAPLPAALRDALAEVTRAGAVTTLEHVAATGRCYAVRVAAVGAHVHLTARDITDELRERRRTTAIARVSDVLTSDEVDLPRTTQATTAILADVLAADCTMALLTPDRQWLEVAAVCMRDAAVAEMMKPLDRWPAGRAYTGEALRTRTTVLASGETLAREAARLEHAGLRDVATRYAPSSMLVAPLLAGDETIGVVTISRRGSEPAFTEEDRAVATDITASIALYLAHARRRAEAQTLRQRLAAVTDSSPALVSLVSADRRYQYLNATYERWWQRPRAQLIGKRLDEVMGDGYAHLAPFVERALAGEEVHYQTEMAYPTGHRHIDVRYVPLRAASGAVDGFASLVLDTTAEHLLAQSERRNTRRLQSLLALTSRLAGAGGEDEIAQILVDDGAAALDATKAALWLIDETRTTLVLARQRGFSPSEASAFPQIPLASTTPLGDAIRTREPVWVASRAEYRASYPEYERSHRAAGEPPIAFGNVPLVIQGEAIGGIAFVFEDEHRLTADDRTYLQLLVAHGAQALRRARLYAELRDVSETRQAMIQASPAATFLVDEHGIVRTWNPAAEHIFGWTASEAVGHPLRPTNDPRVLVEGHTLHAMQTRWHRRSGELFDVELYAAPVRTSDGRTSCLAMAFDVSERVRVERGRQLIAEAGAILNHSLRREDTLRDLVQLPLAHFADWCGVDLLTSEGDLERVAGARGGEPARAPRRLAHGHEYPGASTAIVQRHPVVLRDIDDATRHRLARDGDHYEALRELALRSVLSVPLLVADRLLGALSIGSRTRNFDELDIAIFSELAGRAATAIENAQLYETAQAARREAESADRAKDQFLAMLGHELRNPLAPITTALHLMKMRAPGTLERERAVVQRQVSHLSRLVDDLLDISRITRGKVDLQRERVALGAVIGRAIEITSPLFEQRRHRLMIDMPEDVIVDGDPTRLDQVLANLLSNAAKYTEPGGMIEIATDRRGAYVALVVRDNGIGIAPDVLPNIFETFVQAPQPSARTDGGLGLGLAIVKSLVELHGGSVVARSAGVGRGTEVEVLLPAARRTAPMAAHVPTPGMARVGRRILVVDDNRDAANMLSEVLDGYGHEILTAFDGPTALELAHVSAPDVAILDIGLPVMDGYELAGRLRALSPMRLIAVTGYGQANDRERARAAGFEAHLAKPVAIDKLLALLDLTVS